MTHYETLKYVVEIYFTIFIYARKNKRIDCQEILYLAFPLFIYLSVLNKLDLITLCICKQIFSLEHYFLWLALIVFLAE
jgi:hypothetical protein